MPGTFPERQVGVLAQGQDQGVGLELFEFAGGLREAGLVQLHLLDQQLAFVGAGDGGQPPHRDALVQGLGDLHVMRGHPVASAAVDHDGFARAEPRAVRAASMAVFPPP